MGGKAEDKAAAALKNLAGSASGTVQLDRPKKVSQAPYTSIFNILSFSFSISFFFFFFKVCLEVSACVA